MRKPARSAHLRLFEIEEAYAVSAYFPATGTSASSFLPVAVRGAFFAASAPDVPIALVTSTITKFVIIFAFMSWRSFAQKASESTSRQRIGRGNELGSRRFGAKRRKPQANAETQRLLSRRSRSALDPRTLTLRLYVSASLRLCVSASLRLCASASLRLCVPHQQLLSAPAVCSALRDHGDPS